MAPCSDAMIDAVITVKPTHTIAEVLDIFEKNDIRSVPVVNDEGKLAGILGLRHILLKLLPASVAMEDGLTRLDFVMGAAPGIAKRLKKLHEKTAEEVMDANPYVLHEDTATWEAVRVMALYGSPLPIVKEKTGDFVGIISRQSLLQDLSRLIQE